MRIKIEFESDAREPENRHVVGSLTYDRSGWVIDGEVGSLTPRLIWLMDTIHKVKQEYHKRDIRSAEMTKVKK